MTSITVSLVGPFALNAGKIDRVVAKNRIGVYLLGPVNSQGLLTVKRVGRSDTDLNSRLKQYGGQYDNFLFAYCSTPKEAFEEECRLYHEYNPPDNSIHPDKPTGTNYRCPVIGCSH